MIKEFENITNLIDVAKCLHKDEDSLPDLIFLVGAKRVKSVTIIDILTEIGMVESKSRFRKNPQIIMVNNMSVSPLSIPVEDEFILTIGKGSSLKCSWIIRECCQDGGLVSACKPDTLET